jgi:hypothetical protein
MPGLTSTKGTKSAVASGHRAAKQRDERAPGSLLGSPHNQSFVGNAAQPTTEIRVTEPVRFEDIAERFALALTRSAKLFG